MVAPLAGNALGDPVTPTHGGRKPPTHGPNSGCVPNAGPPSSGLSAPKIYPCCQQAVKCCPPGGTGIARGKFCLQGHKNYACRVGAVRAVRKFFPRKCPNALVQAHGHPKAAVVERPFDQVAAHSSPRKRCTALECRPMRFPRSQWLNYNLSPSNPSPSTPSPCITSRDNPSDPGRVAPRTFAPDIFRHPT